MTSNEINKKIQSMIIDPNITEDEVIRYVKGECSSTALSPQTLGMLFEMYAGVKYDENDPSTCYSKVITIKELKNIHPSFESTNGCQWARSDSSYLGKRYIIDRPKEGNKVKSIQLIGQNNSLKKYRGIRKDIVDEISKQRCSILDVGTNIEVDHKNGRYDDISNTDSKTQNIEDFQALSKSANDAKRQHCKECIREGKRYDARRLGYKEGWVLGDENTSTCIGCYWYDPQKFNELISNTYEKKDEE